MVEWNKLCNPAPQDVCQTANIHIWSDDNNDVCDDANDQCGDGSIILFSQVVYHIANIYELMGDNDQATEWYK